MKRGQPDPWLFAVTMGLLTIGIVMVLSASSYHAMLYYEDPYHFFKRQIMWAVLGLVAMGFMSNIDYHWLSKISHQVMAVIVGLLVLVLFVGEEINGSARWIDLGFISFGPAEIAKMVIVYCYAKMLSDDLHLLKSPVGYMKSYVLLVITLGLILAQPDLGTSVSIAAAVFCIIIVAGAPGKYLWSTVFAGVVGVAGFIAIEPYRLARFEAYFAPFDFAQTSGYQIVQSLYALGSGWLFGVGLGNSRQKFMYLPERHTDFIFAVIGEELGFIGAMLVIILFALFAWRGFFIAMRCVDRLGSLIAVGLTSIVIVQAAINLGVVVGLIPVTGITLPFISYGGTSLVFMMAGVGALLNVSRYSAANRIQKNNERPARARRR